MAYLNDWFLLREIGRSSLEEIEIDVFSFGFWLITVIFNSYYYVVFSVNYYAKTFCMSSCVFFSAFSNVYVIYFILDLLAIIL